jgi:hypothetical protein
MQALVSSETSNVSRARRLRLRKIFAGEVAPRLARSFDLVSRIERVALLWAIRLGKPPNSTEQPLLIDRRLAINAGAIQEGVHESDKR